MQIYNHHERILALPLATVASRLGTLATREDTVWPPQWPRMRLD